ncbi:MAG: 1-(5-phosphoribosyl)-5-[(5-phosphoribosylamino) methylideneamino] imidazole-4-carboxamide isomerase [Phycisphaerae bacterium]|jgi:phosphoribosylformimino-5-aminoimidazole carboxamide ribotide isomerase|nr:MAG: 1-(5-phosphoribosyl)-5-[(5-phosphoribosylamino) methylideneamino] imidazole-4-carboxamide isomerase [Phycisphaerae bacterium]
MRFTIVPSIDLRQGQVIRLQQGDYAQQINYDVDPIHTARQFKTEGAEWLHIVDLDGAKEGRCVQTDLISRIISASGLKVQVGGGVRSTADVDRLIECGAQRVVVGTKAIEDWSWFESLVEQSQYAQKLVLAIDAKNGMVATRGWTQTSQIRAVDIACRVSDWPLAGLLYTDVSRDGMMGGPNLEQTRHLAEAGRVPVIASGGVGTLDHIRSLLTLPIWGVIVGRSLYERRISLHQAIKLIRTD